MEGQIRQGDVLLVPMALEPEQGVQPTNEVVLAWGEVTGHAHRLKAIEILEWSVGEQRYVRVLGDQPGELSHEDHDPIPAAVVQPNVTYQVIHQQEWDLSGQWRKVVD